jgi:hypothetical protein
MRNAGEILKPLIQLSDDASGCWLWLGKIGKRTGYGYKQIGGKTVLAHRWVYSIFGGWIPKGKVINHLCSNRRCVNPKHLEVTTTAGNCRHGRGTKLTLEQAVEIKRLIPGLKWGERKQIARRFGVSEGLISDIKYGRAWADI